MKENPLIIRQALPSDARNLAEIHIRSWQKAYAELLPAEFLASLDIKRRAQGFERSIRAKEEDTWVVLDQDKTMVGFITLGPNRDEDLPDDTGEIWGIYLHPIQWRKGYGRTMFLWTFDELRQRGYKHVVLWAFENNRRGEAFYTATDFVKDGRHKIIPKFPNQPVVRYWRKID